MIDARGTVCKCRLCGITRTVVIADGVEMCVICAQLAGHYRRFIRGKDMRYR